MVNDQISRRKALLGVVSSGALAVVGSAALTSCSGEEAQGPTATGNNVRLPEYRRRTEITPDLVELDQRIPEAYLSYPADPPKVNKSVPLSGGKVTAFCEVSTVPPPLDKNRFWQELNKRLGGELEIQMAPTADYAAKFQTLVAGDQLPEIVQLKPALRDLPNLLKARFLDLSDLLSGTAVREYPNLASIPSYAWKACIYNNGLYGVPFSLPAVPNGLFARTDIIDSLGLSIEVNSGEEFLSLCREVTDAKRNRYALSAPTTMLNSFFVPMHGGPNQWKVEGGQFTSWWETDEYKTALENVAAAFKQQLFHPDSLAKPQAKQWFGNGATVFNPDGLTAWPSYVRDYGTSGKPFNLGLVRPPKWGGGGPAKAFQGGGIYTFVGLTTRDKKRAADLLRLIDWLAAPIGSEEFRFRTYGIKDHNYRLEGTDPVAAGAIDEVRLPTSYIGRGAPYIYTPGDPDGTRYQFEFQKAVNPDSAPLPTIGLYSASAATIGATAGKKVGDLIIDIIAGRKPLSEWDDAIREWRSAAGDKIKAEYAQSLSEQED